ncbi:hypothetical protein EYZ11_004354 [Aspergillus tanneri]|uniref:Uncharacterized protein n=1 Tax=Aspergillus tanneri TaxID=1220188 RepID=A0A4S3JRP3_9EURO|nr:hypothetical protein EYZ11_004354 [Aspergillus tanneri]
MPESLAISGSTGWLSPMPSFHVEV